MGKKTSLKLIQVEFVLKMEGKISKELVIDEKTQV